MLNSMGVTKVFLMMASCKNDELCEQGLLLGQNVLQDGNVEVQHKIHTVPPPRPELGPLAFAADRPGGGEEGGLHHGGP
eukprot:3059642-Prymnesium_polylepis.1